MPNGHCSLILLVPCDVANTRLLQCRVFLTTSDSLNEIRNQPIALFSRVVGAINVSTNAARIDLATLTESFLPLLQENTRQIATQVS